MSPVTTPQRQPVPVLLTLANARRPRRPAGIREQVAPDPFSSYPDAQALLAPLGLSQPLAPGELADLTALANEALDVAEALAGRQAMPAQTTLNQLAGQATAIRTLHVEPDGTLRAKLCWQARSATAELASRIIGELGRLDPARLHHCSREACDLLFYDTTRPGTQRWHSETPCGRRERQARWRSTSKATTA